MNDTQKALLSQMQGFLKAYTDQKVELEMAVINYTRQFPHRVHKVIAVLLEEREYLMASLHEPE